ncbi:MAG: TonB-dependent receptor [Bacteroidota bacterium]
MLSLRLMNRVLLYSLLLLVCLLPLLAGAQVVSVIDKTTLEPVAGASIRKRTTPPEPLETNADGQVKLSPRFKVAADTLFIYHPEYKSRALTYAELDSADWTIQLRPAAFGTEPLVIATGRFDGLNRAPEPSAFIIGPRRIRMYNSPTTAHLLEDHAAAFVQRSPLGGGSPNLRGFEANRVLIVVDGIRVNNAIFRGVHLHNILAVDVNTLERVEVLNGTGAVEYGSDALGGVMALFTRDPQLSDDPEKRVVKGEMLGRYSSAVGEATGHVELNVGRDKFASFSALTISDFGDLRAGNNFMSDAARDWRRPFVVQRIDGRDSLVANDDPLMQSPSGYTQIDGLQKFLFRPSARSEHLINFQFSSTSDVPRYDRLTDTTADGRLQRAEWFYGPQLRLTGAYRYTHRETRLYDQLTVQGAYQQFRESRHTRNFGSVWLNSRFEKVDVLSLNLNAAKRLSSKHQLLYGLDAQHNWVATQARQEHIEIDSTRSLDTRYPAGGSQMGFAAAFVRHIWQPREEWRLSSALRYTYTWLSADFGDRSFYPFLPASIENRQQALTGALELQARPTAWLRPYGRLSTAFRSPNVDDVGKVFDSEPGRVIVPNESIGPEYTYTAEAGLSGHLPQRLSYQINTYLTLNDNAPGFQPASVGGQDSVVYDGQPSAVEQIVNLERGLLYGLQFSGQVQLIGPFSFKQQIGFTKGYILQTERPLSHIPPLFGLSELQLMVKRFQARFTVRYQGEKSLNEYAPGGEDNLRYATPTGMPAWFTMNLYTDFSITSSLKISAALENILDRHYRVFASGISAPGINFILSLRYAF